MENKSIPGNCAPVIVLANYARFQAGQILLNPEVESRMCLWCKAGSGEVHVNGATIPMHAGAYLFLPWRHRIKYIADAKRPFLLAGIHLIPWHAPTKPVTFEVSHNNSHALHNARWRQDRPLETLDGVLHLHMDADAPLWLFSEYIVCRYRQDTPDETHMRQLAGLLLHELRVATTRTPADAHAFPAELQEMLHHIRAHLGQPIAVETLARLIHRSLSHVGRLFRQHLGVSPVGWINGQKVEAAKDLLTTTRWPVAKVARQVGMDDQFYFSKLFKQHTGVPPLAYRKQQHL